MPFRPQCWEGAGLKNESRRFLEAEISPPFSQPASPGTPLSLVYGCIMAAVKALNPKAEVARAQAALAVNISAARGLQDVLKSNLGPKGTMKMWVLWLSIMRTVTSGTIVWSACHTSSMLTLNFPKKFPFVSRTDSDVDCVDTHCSLSRPDILPNERLTSGTT